MDISNDIANGLALFFSVSNAIEGSCVSYKTNDQSLVSLNVDKRKYQEGIVTSFLAGDKLNGPSVNLYDVTAITYAQTGEKYVIQANTNVYFSGETLPEGYVTEAVDDTYVATSVYIDKVLTIVTAADGTLTYTVKKVSAGTIYKVPNE